jgi:3-hydroxyacyl-[acyl-carrier-protein] dehydratase
MPLRTGANWRGRADSGLRDYTRCPYNGKFGGDAEKPQYGRRDGEFRMIMDVMEIQKYLPHRYPFLMVDGILEIERLKRIVGIKNVSATESHFQGHFPGQPVMPGVLIIESMAQTGGLLLLLEVPDRQNKLLFFVAVDGARFRRPVVPGEQLKIEMNVLSWRGDFCKLEGKAFVDGQLAAEATLMCKMVDRDMAASKEPAKPTEKVAK